MLVVVAARAIMAVVMAVIVMMVIVMVPVGMGMAVPVVMVSVAVIGIVVGADAADVKVVAGLRSTTIRLVADHLLAVLAQQAVHQVGAVQRFVQPVGKGIDDQRMIVEIVGLDDLDLRVRRGAGIGVGVDAVDEDAITVRVGRSFAAAFQ